VRARPLWGMRGLVGGHRRPLARRLPMAPSWPTHAMPTASQQARQAAAEEGWQDVSRRMQWRRAARQVSPRANRRPVPADLVSLWFNYLRPNHVAAVCPNVARCLRCHQARACKRRRSADAATLPPPQCQPRLAYVIVINPGKGNVALAERRDRCPRLCSSTLPGSSKVTTLEGSPFTSRSTVTPTAILEILARVK
jgi:hypothetical protein